MSSKIKEVAKGSQATLAKPTETPVVKPPAVTTSTPAAPGNTPAPAKRSRSALSTEKMLAIQISHLTSILKRDNIIALLSDEDKAKVDAASKAAADLNAKTIGPVKARIAEIETELKSQLEASQKPGASFSAIAEKVTALAKELKKKQTQLESLTKLAA